MSGKLNGKKVGFIGGGMMGEALIAGLIGSGACPAGDIVVCDVSEARLNHLRAKYAVGTSQETLGVVGKSGIIVFAVKPQNLPDVLREIGPSVHGETLFVSIAAGVTLASLAWYAKAKVVRAMPNICAQVGEGMTALTSTASVTDDEKGLVQTMFESVGKAIWVGEEKMDAVTGISGSGPAYLLLVMEAMIQAGVAAGLAPEQSKQLVYQTVKGAAQMAIATGESPAALREKITSPQGTTAAALYELEQHGVRAAFLDAVAAAVRRSKELG